MVGVYLFMGDVVDIYKHSLTIRYSLVSYMTPFFGGGDFSPLLWGYSQGAVKLPNSSTDNLDNFHTFVWTSLQKYCLY